MKTVKYIIASLVIVLGLSTSSFADYKYNAWTGQWENVGSNYEMTYDPWNSDWSYQKPNAQPEYNPWTGNWEYER